MNEEVCSKFLEELRKTPEKMMNYWKDQKNSPMMKGILEAQKQARGEGGNPFEAYKMS